MTFQLTIKQLSHLNILIYNHYDIDMALNWLEENSFKINHKGLRIIYHFKHISKERINLIENVLTL